MVDVKMTTWRIVGIAYATITHMTAHIENKNLGIPRFIVDEGTEDEMKDKFETLKRICPIIELYNDDGIVERHDELLDICAESIFPDRSPAGSRQSTMYTHIGKLMFRVDS